MNSLFKLQLLTEITRKYSATRSTINMLDHWTLVEDGHLSPLLYHYFLNLPIDINELKTTLKAAARGYELKQIRRVTEDYDEEQLLLGRH